MITKAKLLELIKKMPEDKYYDIDILLDRIILPEKIENGLNDIKEGNIISEEEMETVIESWFKK